MKFPSQCPCSTTWISCVMEVNPFPPLITQQCNFPTIYHHHMITTVIQKGKGKNYQAQCHLILFNEVPDNIHTTLLLLLQQTQTEITVAVLCLITLQYFHGYTNKFLNLQGLMFTNGLGCSLTAHTNLLLTQLINSRLHRRKGSTSHHSNNTNYNILIIILNNHCSVTFMYYTMLHKTSGPLPKNILNISDLLTERMIDWLV